MMMIMAQHPQNQSQRHSHLTQKQQQQHDADSNVSNNLRDKIMTTSNHFVAVAPLVSAKLTNQFETPNLQQQSAGMHQIAAPIITKQAVSSDQQTSKSKHQRNIHPHLDTSEKQIQDGKRTLIKNQLYLIEQLQLENVNLRNERDQLQLENEELKFQLQMIR